ncbi:MAG: hypothetical protein IH946_04555 [Bacteroidetes bacterium]|nr:hypothetical protein [Bacteroidota bacterium]
MKKLTFLLSLLLTLSVGATSTDSPTGSPVGSPTRNLTSLPSAGAGASAILGANFDGTNDYLTRGGGLTGISDGDELTIAARYRINTSDITSIMRIASSTGNSTVGLFGIDEVLVMSAENSAGSDVVRALSSTTTALEAYANFLWSVKLSATAVQHLYLDDVDRLTSAVLTEAETIDFTVADWAIGAAADGNFKIDADINAYGMWLNYWDFSSSTERRKFFNADGTWAIDNDNTSDGIIDSITPLIWLAGEFDQWEDNKGPGEGFTVTGALTEPAD